jgi:hypothetical protein
MGNYHPILMQIGTQTQENMLFKMAAAAILLIQVNAINWAITTRF